MGHHLGKRQPHSPGLSLQYSLGKPPEFSDEFCCSKEGDEEEGPFPENWLLQVGRTLLIFLRLPLCASRCHPSGVWSSTCSSQVTYPGCGLIPREPHFAPKSQAIKCFDLASTSTMANLHTQPLVLDESKE